MLINEYSCVSFYLASILYPIFFNKFEIGIYFLVIYSGLNPRCVKVNDDYLDTDYHE